VPKPNFDQVVFPASVIMMLIAVIVTLVAMSRGISADVQGATSCKTPFENQLGGVSVLLGKCRYKINNLPCNKVCSSTELSFFDDHLTISGVVNLARGVTLKGTVKIIANEGSTIDIPELNGDDAPSVAAAPVAPADLAAAQCSQQQCCCS